MFRSGRRSKPGVARMPRVNPVLGNRSGVNMASVRASANRLRHKRAHVIDHTGSYARGEARHYGVTRRHENYGTTLLNDITPLSYQIAEAIQELTVTPTPNAVIEVVGKVINPLPFPQYVCLHTGALQARMVGILDDTGKLWTCLLDYSEIEPLLSPCAMTSVSTFDITLYTSPDVNPNKILPQPTPSVLPVTGATATVLIDPIDGGDVQDNAGRKVIDNDLVTNPLPTNIIEGGKP